MTRLLLLTMGSLLLWPVGGWAQSAPPVSQPSVRALAQLVVNGSAQGDTWLFIDGDDVLVPLSRLHASGLRWTHATETLVDDEVFVSLRSMEPAVAFVLNTADVQLVVTVPSEMFGARTTIGGRGGPAASRPRPASAFLNYGATVTSRRTFTWATETGVRLAGGVFQTSLSGTDSGRRARGPITFTLDDERRLVRWQAGDAAVGSVLPGGLVPAFGLTVSSEFSIDPQFTTFAPVSLAGATSVPAVADVYVNNQLVTRTDVAPGSFDLRDLPVPVGAGDVRVVLRDEFGRQQEIAREYYRSPGLLRPGLQAFRYAIGASRLESDGLAWRYGPLAGSFEHRRGVTEWLTVGGSGGFASHAVFGGGDLALRLPVGEAAIEARVSRQGEAPGALALVSYLYRGHRVSGQASVRALSSSIRETSATIFDRPRAVEGLAALDLVVGHGVSAGARYRPSHIGAVMSMPLPARLSLSTTIWRSADAGHAWTALAVLTMPVARRTSASVSYDASSGRGGTAQTSVQRALDLGPGVGYHAQWQDGGTTSVGDASLQYQGGPIRLEGRRDMFGAEGVTSLTVSGAVVGIERTVRLSRPVTDAFALVRVSGLQGVRTYLSNQFVGRTGRWGDIVLPSLASYNANRIDIDDRDVPIDADLTRTDALIAPGLRGGGVVRFAVTPAPAALRDIRPQSTVRAFGDFHVGEGPEALVDAEARVRWTNGEERIRLRADGRFEFVRATMGTHRVDVRGPSGAFVCTLVLLPTAVQSDGSEPLGAVPCQAVPTQVAFAEDAP